MKDHRYFNLAKGISVVCGIDTDIGKSVVTAAIYRELLQSNESVMTGKLVQTGCVDKSEDILLHRKIAKQKENYFDLSGESCPYLFSFPASPHLAAKIDKKVIDTDVIFQSMNKISKEFDFLLAESAGGLMVPLNNNSLIIDLIEKSDWPIILVTSPRLGSINHTLLSLEVLKQRDIELSLLVYNSFGKVNSVIEADSLALFNVKVAQYFPKAKVIVYKNQFFK